MIPWLRRWGALVVVVVIIVGAARGTFAQFADGEANGEHCLSAYVAQEPSLSTAAQINKETRALAADPDNIDALIRRATVYRSIGYFREALIDYNHILEIDPDYTENEFVCNLAYTYMLVAEQYLDEQDYETAMFAVEMALETDPTLPSYAPIYVYRGLIYAERGEFDLALADYTDAINTLNSARAYADRGIVYQMQGELEAALDDLNTALELDPDYFYPYYTRSQVRSAMGDIDGALDDLNSLIEKMPFANAYVNRGAIYTQLGEYDLAMSDFEMAMERSSENVYAYINRGNLYYVLGQYEEALADETEAIRLDPSKSGAFLYRSYVYMALGEYDAALDDVNQAIDVEPSLQAYYVRARINAAQGAYEAALDDLEIVLDAIPSSVDVLVFRAFIYQWEENYEAALSDFNRIIVLNPSNAINYSNRAYIYVKLGDHDNALDDYNHAIALDPSAGSYVRRGYGYDEMGNHEAALEDFTHAIELDPTNAGFYLTRGASHNEAGEIEEAAADYLEWVQRSEIESIEENELEFGNRQTLEMTEGRVYRIPFEGQAGQTIQITANSAEGVSNDPLVVLLDADEQPIVSDDDSGDAVNSVIDGFRLPASGRYWIVLSHAGGGTEGDIVLTLSLLNS